jgi:peptidoglycan hydrolase CwlO-like protein
MALSASLEQQLNSANQQVNQLNAEVRSHEHTAETLEAQLKAMDAEARRIRDSILSTQRNINAANAEIAAADQALAAKKAIFKEQIRAAYINPNPTTFEVLVGSNNLSNFIDSREYLERSEERIQALMADIVAQKQLLDAKKAQLDGLKAELGRQQDSLNAQMAAKNSLLIQTRGEQARYETLLKEAMAVREAVNASLIRLAQSGNYVSRGHVERGQVIGYQGNTGNSYGEHLHFEVRLGGQTVDPGPYLSSGRVNWPLANHTQTQGYGAASCGYCGYDFHTGLDVAGPIGSPVLAAAAGEIIVNTSVGDGYGHKIIIDHGGGLWTLYAHLR